MVGLDSNGELTRHQVATFLREFADELDGDLHTGESESREGCDSRAGGSHRTEAVDITGADHQAKGDEGHRGGTGPERITIVVGRDSATVILPETVEFEIDVESRSPMLSREVRQAIELKLSWAIDPEEYDDDSIEIK